MILIELTEKDLRTIRASVEDSKNSSVKAYEEAKLEIDKIVIERCESVLSKLDQASIPREDVLIKTKDLFLIKSMAVSEHHRLNAPTFLTKVLVEQKDLVHISLVSAFVMWLNNRSLLKNLVKFDYTDDSVNNESIED